MEPIKNKEFSGINSNTRCFSPADVAAAFGPSFLDEAACRRWIVTKLHGNGHVHCPACQAEARGRAFVAFQEGRKVRCRSCGKIYTALTGTFLSGCHMTFQQIVMLCFLLNLGAAHREVARILNISVETARLWDMKFRIMARTDPGRCEGKDKPIFFERSTK